MPAHLLRGDPWGDDRHWDLERVEILRATRRGSAQQESGRAHESVGRSEQQPAKVGGTQGERRRYRVCRVVFRGVSRVREACDRVQPAVSDAAAVPPPLIDSGGATSELGADERWGRRLTVSDVGLLELLHVELGARCGGKLEARHRAERSQPACHDGTGAGSSSGVAAGDVYGNEMISIQPEQGQTGRSFTATHGSIHVIILSS